MYEELHKLGFKLDSGKGASETQISDLESKLGIKIGEQYREFLKEFGVLSVEYLEFYGIAKSDDCIPSAVFATLSAREDIDFYKDFVVVQDIGEGSFYCIDSNDNVYLCEYGEFDKPKDLKMKFKDFLIKEINELKE